MKIPSPSFPKLRSQSVNKWGVVTKDDPLPQHGAIQKRTAAKRKQLAALAVLYVHSLAISESSDIEPQSRCDSSLDGDADVDSSLSPSQPSTPTPLASSPGSPANLLGLHNASPDLSSHNKGSKIGQVQQSSQPTSPSNITSISPSAIPSPSNATHTPPSAIPSPSNATHTPPSTIPSPSNATHTPTSTTPSPSKGWFGRILKAVSRTPEPDGLSTAPPFTHTKADQHSNEPPTTAGQRKPDYGSILNLSSPPSKCTAGSLTQRTQQDCPTPTHHAHGHTLDKDSNQRNTDPSQHAPINSHNHPYRTEVSRTDLQRTQRNQSVTPTKSPATAKHGSRERESPPACASGCHADLSEDDTPNLQPAISPAQQVRKKKSGNGSPLMTPALFAGVSLPSLNFITNRKSVERLETDMGLVVVTKRRSAVDRVPILKLPDALVRSPEGKADHDGGVSCLNKLPPLSGKDSHHAAKQAALSSRAPLPRPPNVLVDSLDDDDDDLDINDQSDSDTSPTGHHLHASTCDTPFTSSTNGPTPRKPPTPHSTRSFVDPYSPQAVSCASPFAPDIQQFDTNSPPGASIPRSSSFLSTSRGEDASWRDQWFGRVSGTGVQASSGSITGCALRDRMLREQLLIRGEPMGNPLAAGASSPGAAVPPTGTLTPGAKSAGAAVPATSTINPGSKSTRAAVPATGTLTPGAKSAGAAVPAISTNTPSSKSARATVPATGTLPAGIKPPGAAIPAAAIRIHADSTQAGTKGMFSFLSRTASKVDEGKAADASMLSGALQRWGSAFNQTWKDAREGLLRDAQHQETDGSGLQRALSLKAERSSSLKYADSP